MAKKNVGKSHKILALEAGGVRKVRQMADYLIGLGRHAVSRANATAVAWILSKKPRTLTSGPLPKVRHKTRKPRMANKTARKGPSKR